MTTWQRPPFSPVSGASLEAEGLDEDLCGTMGDSRDDGRYFLSLTDPGRFSVKVEHEDYVSKSAEVTAGTAAPAELDFALARKPSVRGTVRDPKGKPMADATVWIEEPKMSVSTDETGAFELKRLPVGTFRVFARSPLHPPAKRKVETREGETAEVVFQMEKGAPLAGRVFSWGQKPLAGAVVRASRSWRDLRETRTDAEGRFRLDGLRPGEEYPFRIECEGFFPEEGVAPAGTESLAILLETPSFIEGRAAAEADGTPIRLLSVSVRPEPGPDAREIEWESTGGPNGTFRSPPLRAGRYRVGASAPGFVPKETAVELGERTVLGDVVLRLRKGVSISGGVLAMDTRQPLQGAEVVASSGQHARTDRQGRFDIGWFDPDVAREIAFRAFHPDYGTASASLQVPPWDPEVWIPLRRGGRVSGLVRMSNGKPAALVAEVRAVWLDGGAESAPPALRRFDTRGGGPDEEGRFEIRGLAPGRHVLRVFPQGDGPCLGEREIRVESDGQELSCDLEMRGAVLSGTVRDADGKPAQGYFVGIVDGAWVRRYEEKDYCCWTRAVEDDGTFVFPGLPPGRHRVGILPPNKQGPVVAEKEFVVERDGQDLKWDVVLPEEE